MFSHAVRGAWSVAHGVGTMAPVVLRQAQRAARVAIRPDDCPIFIQTPMVAGLMAIVISAKANSRESGLKAGKPNTIFFSAAALHFQSTWNCWRHVSPRGLICTRSVFWLKSKNKRLYKSLIFVHNYGVFFDNLLMKEGPNYVEPDHVDRNPDQRASTHDHSIRFPGPLPKPTIPLDESLFFPGAPLELLNTSANPMARSSVF